MSVRADYTLDLDRQLVWMTCGGDAGYQLLLAPGGSDWTALLETAFPDFEIGPSQRRAMALEFESRPALALAFFDPEHCDGSSRPIKHFLLLLDVDATLADDAELILLKPLLEQLSPAFQVLYEASRYTSEREICRLARDKMAGRKTLSLSFDKSRNKSKSARKDKADKNKDKDKSKDKLQLSDHALTHGTESHEHDEALGMPRLLMLALAIAVLLAILAAVAVSMRG